MKKWLSLLLVMALFTTLPAAFAEGDTSEFVELNYYNIGVQYPDDAAVVAAINELALEDLNCKLNVTWLHDDARTTTYPLLLSSDENIDFIFTGSGCDFVSRASQGAYEPLEELLPKYAPTLWEYYTEEQWAQATINGHIYAIPSNYNTPEVFGVMVRGDLMDKYGVTDEDFKSIYDVLAFGKKINAAEDGLVSPINVYYVGFLYDATLMGNEGYQPLNGDITCPYWFDAHEENPKVFIKTEWDGMREYLEFNADLYAAGCWNSNELVDTATDDFVRGVVGINAGHPLQWQTTFQNVPSEWDIRYYEFNENDVPSASYMAYGLAIPASNTKNIARTLAFIEKAMTDERYNMLFNYGIEGQNYKVIDENTIEPLNPSTFMIPSDYRPFRSNDFEKVIAPYPNNYVETVEKAYAKIVPNRFATFIMNSEPVKAQYAAVNDVINEIYKPLELGYIPVDEGLEKLDAALEAAGVDKVLEEFQRQLDEFIAQQK